MSTDPTSSSTGSGRVRRWAVLGGAWSVYAAFGLLVATTGALVPQIQADLGLTDGQMGAVLGAWQLVFIAASIPAGRIIDRFGIRRALVAAMTIMLMSGFGRSAADGFGSLLVAVALLGVGAPLISVGAPTVAAGLFEGRDRRLAVGIYSTAPGIGGVIGLVLPGNVVGPLVGSGATGDWRRIVIVLSALAAVGLVVWLLVAGGPGRAERPLDRVLQPGSGPGLGDYVGIARLPVVRFVLALSVAAFFVIHGVGQWTVAILVDAGWSVGAAGAWAGLGTVGGLVASFVLPGLATPERRPALLIGTLALGAGAIQFLATGAGVVLAPAIVATYVARSALVPLLVMTLMDHPDVGPTRTAAATGLFFTTAQFGGVAGPVTTGLLAGTGGFDSALVAHSVVLVAIAVVVGVGYRRALG